MVHIFSKMLLSRVNFSSWLTSLWSLDMFFSEVNVTLHDIVCKLIYWRLSTVETLIWAIPCHMIRISISCTLSFNTLSEAHSCLFRAVTGVIKAEEMITCAPRCFSWAKLRQSDLTPQRQNGIYVFELSNKMDVIWIGDFVSYQ